MRSSPQVIGAARVTSCAGRGASSRSKPPAWRDNPLFFPTTAVVLTGANFQGSPISLPLDSLGAAITMVCVLSEKAPQSAHEPGSKRGTSRVPHERRRSCSRADAQPVHRGTCRS